MMSWLIVWANPHPNEKAMKKIQAATTAFDALSSVTMKALELGAHPFVSNKITEPCPNY